MRAYYRKRDIMKIDLCIPAYNEAPIIVDTLHTVLKSLPTLQGVSWHVTVADNASTDGTGDVVRRLNLPDVSVLSVPVKGKGAAILAAAAQSQGEAFGFIDADLSANPSSFGDLLTTILAGNDIAIGSRLMRGAAVHRGGLRTFSSEVFNYMRRVLLGVKVEDISCGLKLTNKQGRDILLQCKELGWFLDVEWLALAQQSHLRIAEVPIEWVEQYYPGRKSKLRVVRDGLKAFAAFARIRTRLQTHTYGKTSL